MLQDGDRLAWLSQQHPTIRGLPVDVAGRAVAGERAFVLVVVLGCCRLLLGSRQCSGARRGIPRQCIPTRFLPEDQRASMGREPVLLAQSCPSQTQRPGCVAEAGCLVAHAHEHVRDHQSAGCD
jgi:hypothetical protein